jgi:hypothetical protein
LSDTNKDGIKASTFDTWALIEANRAAAVKALVVKVDNKAATRQAIIVSLRRSKFMVKTRSDWNARPSSTAPHPDWDYKAIAIHHAGNSYSCAADGVVQLRRAESTDIDSFGHISYHYAIDCQGSIYEGLDIRYRGAHVESGNTGVIGIVFLADLSVRGETEKFGPGAANVANAKGPIAGFKEWLGAKVDAADTSHDEPTERQLEAASALTKVLTQFFPIKTLGGHREFAKRKGSSRACPGAYGMIVAAQLRRELSLTAP